MYYIQIRNVLLLLITRGDHKDSIGTQLESGIYNVFRYIPFVVGKFVLRFNRWPRDVVAVQCEWHFFGTTIL